MEMLQIIVPAISSGRDSNTSSSSSSITSNLPSSHSVSSLEGSSSSSSISAPVLEFNDKYALYQFAFAQEETKGMNALRSTMTTSIYVWGRCVHSLVVAEVGVICCCY